MKLKKLNLSSQLLILLLGSLLLGLMLQMAQAQTATSSRDAQVLQINMPQRSLLRKLVEDTSFSYYHQFLGPTVGGAGGESYNVFQEGRTPYQSFHAMSLRHQLNPDWAIGASLAVVNAYGETVTSQQNGSRSKMLRDEFFNARAFITIPAWKTFLGSLYTTISYETPTSVVARQDDMRYGLVLTQSYAFNLPSLAWTAGFMWQYYRAYYKQNVLPANALFPGSFPVARQTTIVSGGPYLAYRINDKWGLNTSVTFDWDQRGEQTSSSQFNNNLPDRARAGVTYYPSVKYLSSVGVFTQGLLKYTPDTQAIGGEFALRF